MNKDTVAGALKNAAGHVKQATGEAIGNDRLANSGAADRVTGATQEAWGKTKDAAHAMGDDIRTHEAVAREDNHSTAHNVRESIAQAAENTKDSISRGVDHLKADLHRDRETTHSR
jgi:uncharacterized protein YjbJ (UPF0337 family)